MSEFKGTKGEWSIFQQDEYIHIENKFSSEAITTLVGWNNDEIGLANAKLIACAPEMLDTLEKCNDFLNKVQSPMTASIFLRNEINDLIKKATE